MLIVRLWEHDICVIVDATCRIDLVSTRGGMKHWFSQGVRVKVRVRVRVGVRVQGLGLGLGLGSGLG